jgi:hypothetical protein
MQWMKISRRAPRFKTSSWAPVAQKKISLGGKSETAAGVLILISDRATCDEAKEDYDQ